MTANNTITDLQVKKVAHLARLSVEEQHLAKHAESLSKVLDLIAQIQGKDTTHVTPMYSPFPEIQTPLREDQVQEISPATSVLVQANAPLTESSLYLVPKVIE